MMMRRWKTRARISLTSLLAGSCLIAGPLGAQELERGQGVRDRPRPEYDATGLRLGAFQAFPSVSLSTEYDDNLFAVSAPQVDDYAFAVEPNVFIRSTWARHELTAEAGGRVERYADITDENNTEAFGAVRGRLDVRRGTHINGSLYYGDLVEARANNSLEQGNALLLTREPITYERATASIGGSHTINRATLSGGYEFSSFNYDDQPLRAGGVSDQDIRDHDVARYKGRFSLAISPDTSLFVNGAYEAWNYDLEIPQALFDRDSDGYEVGGGVKFKLGRIAEGEVFAGYQERAFDDDPRLTDTSAVDYGVAVQWHLTQYTTVSVNAESDIRESTVATASSFVRNSAELIVDHEVLRNILVRGRFWYGRDGFENVSRTDEWVALGARADYLVNRNVGLFVSYDFFDQDSDLPIVNYDNSIIIIGAKLQL